MVCPHYRKSDTTPICGALPEQFLSPVLPERRLFCESADDYRACKIYLSISQSNQAMDPLKAAEKRFKETWQERARVMEKIERKDRKV